MSLTADHHVSAPARVRRSLRARRAFTLSEMLVVLGVLVVVAALAQPAMRGALGDSRLRSAAQQVCAQLAKTRLKAMQSGTSQQFRYQIGSNHFEVGPLETADEAEADFRSRDDRQLESRGRLAERPAHDRNGAAEQPVTDAPVEQSLPEATAFGELPTELESPAPIAEEGWSEPIVFHPNGRTHSARIRIKGERNAVIEVSLRGLTGVATAGKMRHEEELR